VIEGIDNKVDELVVGCRVTAFDSFAFVGMREG
jgi:hypothetical protein